MSTPHTYGHIATESLWRNNPALVQILGMCPLLAISTNFVNGLGLGLATLLTLTLTNASVSLIRDYLRSEIRIPVFVVMIAAIVTAIEMLMNAFFHDLYNILGIFIPLIVTNCVVIARAEAFASKNPVPAAMWDGFTMGFGFLLVLVTLGSIREILGKGTLLSQAHLMFGERAHALTITVFDDYGGWLLAVLPPGAFIGLGCLIALKNVIDRWRAERAPRPAAQPAPVAAANV